MRKQNFAVVLGLVLLLAVVARADRITFDYDHSVNFSKYKTFMWIQGPETNDPFMKDRIRKAVTAQLIARGMQEVSNGADMAVGANLASEEKHSWETYYSGSGWGWGSGWSTTEMRTYQVGTLTVDLFDAECHKLVWQGVGVDEISSKPEKETKENNKQIEKMFRSYPGYTHIG